MQDTPSLASQLAEYKAGFKQRVAPERVAMMESATAALKASGIEQTALQVGAAAPELTLPDALGRAVSLRSLWLEGPVVLIFYRGGWCPYCNLELRAWQRKLPELQALGARLVAVSPQTPDNSLSTAEKNELAFPVLSDSSLAAAQAFGVAFTLPAELVELYGRVGNDLPSLNGNGQWVLPLPATYLIDRQGRIVFAHMEADYRERAEPQEVLDALRTLETPQTRDPAEFTQIFKRNFDAKRVDAIVSGYSTQAVLDLGNGQVFRGRDQIRLAIENFLAPGLPIEVTQRHVQRTEDDALVLFDWSIHGVAPDGSAVQLAGAAIDVLQREADGVWRQVLDMPFGQAATVG